MNARHPDGFAEAVALAVRDFAHVTRKGTSVPYISHLFAVTALVAEAGGDEDQRIAAVLHDWLEDVEGASPAYLEARFGARVRRMVEQLSDTQVRPKPPWRARKEAYLAHLRAEPAEVKLVSCADKLHNASTLVRDIDVDGGRLETMDRFAGGRDGTLWYYQACYEALSDGWDHPWLLAELRAVVKRLEDLVGSGIRQQEG